MDIDEIRRENIKALEKAMGTSLVKKLGMSPAQFYNLRDGAKDSKTGKQRGMRKETAWRIEDAAGKPRGWLSVDHSNELSNTEAVPSALNPKQQALLGYFNGLTESQQEEVMRELQEKKQQNDNLLLELLERKANHK